MTVARMTEMFCVGFVSSSSPRNEIEMHFLHLLQFNTEVTGRMYARYYFDLLAIAEKNNVHDLFETLGKVEPKAQR